ncbi:hypothetical protein BpHYR1_042664 [Brachionus plicatilis]|uniref:Protein-tyrosine sulfotransferase n=1 Tax=Brachionus plicatilis TaxID=10195 RepID=A0A3M7PC38_BRAPC|nr:hypothetical protein BpHYR1_042664 [Brachionus plicatilis]
MTRRLVLKKKKSDIESLQSSPIIVIGGFGRSGTTLVRTMLDTHPSIQCGPETKIIPRFAAFMKTYQGKLLDDLREAGIDKPLINEAAVKFIHHILRNRALRTSKRLCLKDPDILNHMQFLRELFPKAKFVHVVRDGRAAAFSFMKKMGEKMDFIRYRYYLSLWNKYNQLIVANCHGSDMCFRVKYEELIEQPERVLRNLLNFLQEDWSEKVLEHEKHLGSVRISRLEWSSDQIKKSIYKNSTSHDFEKMIANYDPIDIAMIAPMLKTLGYNVSYSKANLQEKKTVGFYDAMLIIGYLFDEMNIKIN